MNELSFFQLKNGYRYNSDSLILADFALNQRLSGEILDLGSGCGIVGLILKKNNDKLMMNLLDIQEENIDLIYKNLKENKLEADVFHRDFLNFTCEKKFDFIVSNPPFYKEGAYRSEDKHKAMSKFQNFLPLKEMIARANSLLKPRGSLLMCYEAQSFMQICYYLEEKKMKIIKMRCVHTDNNSKARLVLIHARKGVKNLCEILPPLFVRENEKNSKEMQIICSRFRLKSYDI